MHLSRYKALQRRNSVGFHNSEHMHRLIQNLTRWTTPKTDLQILENGVNGGIHYLSYYLSKTYTVVTHYKCPTEAVLTSTIIYVWREISQVLI